MMLEVINKSKPEIDIQQWHDLGYRKYTMGEFDRALLAFAFGALTNHIDSIKAAGYIWANNMTEELT